MERANHNAPSSQPDLHWLPINSLRFDERNPRLADRAGREKSQQQIQEFLLEEMNARELVSSFMTNGYIPYDPLIVRETGEPDVWRVVEGNRRLAALLFMRDSDDTAVRAAFERLGLSRVPCVVFVGDEEQEFAYLGLRHISKTRDWSSAAKAAFIERLLRAGHSVERTAALTNITRPTLRQLLLVRRLFERAETLDLLALRKDGGVEDETRFWHLGDAVRRVRTQRYLRLEEKDDPLQQPEVDETRFGHLVGWLYGNPSLKQPRLIESIRDIPQLDACLGNDRSIKLLEEGGKIADALEAASAAGAQVTAHLDRARRSVQLALGTLTDVEATSWTEVDASVAALEKTMKALRSALKNAKPTEKKVLKQ